MHKPLSVPPKKNKSGQGEASKQKHPHWGTRKKEKKQIKAAKAKAKKGEVEGRKCERGKAKMEEMAVSISRRCSKSN